MTTSAENVPMEAPSTSANATKAIAIAKATDIRLRPMKCELNPLSRADSSAILAQGLTCVIVSVNGPLGPRASEINYERADFEFTYRPKCGTTTKENKLSGSLIRDTCISAVNDVLHPRTCISIQVQELENHYGLEACAINALCLSMLVSALPLKYTFAALHCIVNKNNELVLDPDAKQAKDCIASFLFAFDSLEKDLITVYTEGRCTQAQFNDAELMCRNASQVIFDFYRSKLAEFTDEHEGLFKDSAQDVPSFEEIAQLAALHPKVKKEDI